MKLNVACNSYLDFCRIQKTLSTHSLKAYTNDILSYLHFLSSMQQLDTNLIECDNNQVKEYTEYLIDKTKLKPRSIKRHIACLKTLFQWLESEGIIETSPFHRFSVSIHIPKQLPRTLNAHDIKHLLLAAARGVGLKRVSNYRLRILPKCLNETNLNKFTGLVAMELMFATGIRVGELIDIELRDIDLHERRIRIRGKGSRERTVFMADNNLNTLIFAYIRLRNTICKTNKLFVTSAGKSASTQLIRRLVGKAGESLGVQYRITPHMLRHTCATQLIEAGVDIRYVQRLLGHQSILTTETYTHISDQSLMYAMCKANTRKAVFNL